MSLLLSRVRAETACVESLLATLEEEDQAITQCRFGELPALTERKTVLLERFAASDRERESALDELGLPPGRAGARAAAEQDDSLRDAWAALLELADRARAVNSRLAAKVYAQLDFTANALAFLQARSQPLYGPDGARQSAGGGSSLAVG